MQPPPDVWCLVAMGVDADVDAAVLNEVEAAAQRRLKESRASYSAPYYFICGFICNASDFLLLLSVI